MRTVLTGAFALMLAALPAAASDWPQFMRDSAHTGDAADETLALPLGLVAQVKLDDAVMTSPAVVGGLVYIVDQMGTAYCVDPRAGRIVWKVSPDGEKAMGSNTSSPCIAKGRMYFGTTAGTLHILDCKDGKVVKTIPVGMPVISAPTFANDSIYFQALDAVVRCMDLDGGEKWKWDHYKRYNPPGPEYGLPKDYPAKNYGFDRPHYGGRPVTVSGTRLVTGVGWDLLCLEDKGKDAEMAWCVRKMWGGMSSVPMFTSISGGDVFLDAMGHDDDRSRYKISLQDGRHEKADVLVGGSLLPAVPPAIRGQTMMTGDGLAYDWAGRKPTRLWSPQRHECAPPAVRSHVFAKDRVVAATMDGEVIVMDLVPKPNGQPFRFKTPHGKAIIGGAAVSGGCLAFGCEDGYLYVLGPGGSQQPIKEAKLAVTAPRSKVAPATGKPYGWPSSFGNPGNTNFADDPGLKPPFRLRWASSAFGWFKTTLIATDNDLLGILCYPGEVICLEQATGRLRWRLNPPGPEWGTEWSFAGLLAADGRLYAPRRNSTRGMPGVLACLDIETGAILWSVPIGGGPFATTTASPQLAAGKVAFGYVTKGDKPVPVVEAWDAVTGAPAWKVELNCTSEMGTVAGCTGGDVMYFSGGYGVWPALKDPSKKRGETVAIEAGTGKVMWRTNEAFCPTGYCAPGLRDGRLYLQDDELYCLSAADGKLLWKAMKGATGFRSPSLGPDFLTTRGYGGHAARFKLSDGAPWPFTAKGAQLGGDAHACSPVTLTPNLSIAPTIGGLFVRDTKTGEVLWASPGFAPRTCTGATLANGRIFLPACGTGGVFCWEPEK